MVHKPDMALLMTVFGSLADGKILAEICSKLTAPQAMPSTFTAQCELLKILHSFSHIVKNYCMALMKIHLKYEALMTLFARRFFTSALWYENALW